MLFGRKDTNQKELQVDLGDLENEEERLSSFLQSNLKIFVANARKKLIVKSERLSAPDLQRTVTKFLYRQKLNTTHWASVEGNTIKINRFKGAAKKKEKQKKKDNTPHQTAIQSWGL